ncbi:MAG: hypothetical protein JW909_13440 [Planctomycetes bacterium]|nr:hypothetical protein [Planctomycetota bacterium]
MGYRNFAGAVLAAGLLLTSTGCGGGGDPAPPDLEVKGFVVNNMPPSFTNVVAFSVMDGGVPVTDATVTVQIGAGAPTTIPHVGGGTYTSGGFSISSGDDVMVQVVNSGATVTVGATVQMPEPPTVTNPTGGSTQDSDADIAVVWNAMSFVPVYVQLLVSGTYTRSSTEWTTIVGVTPPAYIPAATLLAGTSDVELQVVSVNHETNLGAQAEGTSYLQVGEFADLVVFNTQP